MNRWLESIDQRFWILLLGVVALYFQQIWVPGFFQDGYLYAALGKNAAEHGHWLVPKLSDLTYSEFDQHPPLFFILEGIFFKIFGASFTTARFFGESFAALSVFGFWYYGKRAGKKDLFFLAALILLVIPYFFKKARFPNLDMPLVLCTIFYYMEAYLHRRGENKGSWVIAGVALGLAFLFKGIAIFYLAFGGITLAMIGGRKFFPFFLKSTLLSVIIASLWPLALLLSGKFYVFEKYLYVQFFHTAVDGRGGEEWNHFIYLKNLLLYFTPVIACYFTFRFYKKKEWFDKDLEVVSLVWILTLFVPLHFFKHKYSHYLLPLYPGLSVLGAIGIYDFYQGKRVPFEKLLKITFLFVAGMVLVFPLTTNSERHPVLFESLRIIKKLPETPSQWVIVGESYEYWSTAGFASFTLGMDVRRIAEDRFDELMREDSRFDDPSVFFVSEIFFNRMIDKYPNNFFFKFHPLMKFKKKNLVLLTARNNFNGFLETDLEASFP